MLLTYIISNSYGSLKAKTRRAYGKTAAGFCRISAESAKNRTPATLRQRALFGN